MTGKTVPHKVLTAASLAVLVAAGPSLATAAMDAGMQAFQAGNYEQAYNEWQPLAESGDPQAQYMVGVLHDHAYDRPRNYKEAAKWYRRAAEQGHIEAAFSLGFLYYNGGEGEVEGGSIEPDPEKAAPWLRQAAGGGDYPMAAYLLGQMYDEGRGVAENPREACYWTTQAAQSGLAAAQYDAGLLYGRGRGCERDLVAAYKWFALAAESGYPGAADNRDRLADALSDSRLDDAKQAVEAAS